MVLNFEEQNFVVFFANKMLSAGIIFRESSKIDFFYLPKSKKSKSKGRLVNNELSIYVKKSKKSL